MKKLLLGLGTLSLAILPVAAVVSCSTAAVKQDLGITVKVANQVAQSKAALDVTAANELPSTTDTEKTKKEAALITALEPIFTGVTVTNVKNITAKATGALKSETVTLTAVGDFQFGEGDKGTATLVSVVPTIATESAKLVNKLSINVSETAATSASKITDDTTLLTYYTKVVLEDGFSYAWKSSTAVKDTVEVVVTVSGPEGTVPAEHTIILSGFPPSK